MGARLPTRRSGWELEAACAEDWVDPDWFVSSEWAYAPPEIAYQLCASCPVKLDCLSHALDGMVDDGVWGGVYLSVQLARQLRHAAERGPEQLQAALAGHGVWPYRGSQGGDDGRKAV